MSDALHGLTHLSVGQPYHPDRTRWDEATQYNYRAGGHELIAFMARPTPQELRAWERGPWEFGLVVRPELLFLLHKPGDMPWSDAPYSWWQVKRQRPEEALPPFELPNPTSRALLTVIMVDAATGLVRHLKGITFSPEFSQALHGAIREQMEASVSAAAYDGAVDRYYRIYGQTEQMLPALVARCTGGEE